jgi:hypothetical protein
MKAVLFCAMMIAARAAAEEIEPPTASVTVVSNASTLKLTHPMEALNRSLYFRSWIDPFEDKLFSCLLVNNVDAHGVEEVSIGAARIATAESTNYYVSLSTSAVLREVKLQLSLDGELVLMEASKIFYQSSKLSDSVFFPCTDALLKRIGASKRVEARFVEQLEKGTRTVKMVFRPENQGRFRVFSEVFIDNKPYRPAGYAAPAAPAAPTKQASQSPGRLGQGMKMGVPSSIYDGIAAKAAQDWPGNFEMQEYQIKNQVEAYQKLQTVR